MTEFADFDICRPGLEVAMQAAWALDLNTQRIFWINDRGLELWNTRDREELFTRDLHSSAPPAVRARIETNKARCRKGEVIREEWILYPGGKKTTVIMEVRLAHHGKDMVLLLQATPVTGLASDELERNFATLHHSSVISSLVQADGTIVSQNPAAMAAFGTRASWFAWFLDPTQASQIASECLAEGSSNALAEVLVEDDSRRWHMIAARAIRDPVTTQISVHAEHVDVSTQIEAQDLAAARGRNLEALEASLALVEQQREEILALSAPLLEVSAHTLAVPLSGRIDRDRAETLTTKLLDVVAKKGISEVILDLTGLVEFEAENAAELERLVAALGLLGAQTALTGVRPTLARTLVRHGFGDRRIRFFRTLAASLERG